MDMTTIQITEEQRERLETYLNDGEPVRNAIEKLLGNEHGELWMEKEISDIVDRRIEDQINVRGGVR